MPVSVVALRFIMHSLMLVGLRLGGRNQKLIQKLIGAEPKTENKEGATSSHVSEQLMNSRCMMDWDQLRVQLRSCSLSLTLLPLISDLMSTCVVVAAVAYICLLVYAVSPTWLLGLTLAMCRCSQKETALFMHLLVSVLEKRFAMSFFKPQPGECAYSVRVEVCRLKLLRESSRSSVSTRTPCKWAK